MPSLLPRQALLKRLDARLALRGNTSDGAQSLLRQLSPSAPKGRKLERYPVRVMLCAYMIQAHPEVVFNKVASGLGEQVRQRLATGAVRLWLMAGEEQGLWTCAMNVWQE